MKIKPKIAIAMSGGVDSSVAAALLVKQGYDVIGVFMKFWSEEVKGKIRENICCSLESSEDARRVCRKLGIPFYVVNMEIPFKEKIVDDFIEQYESGRTPNPCVRCNQYIKFGELWKRLKPMGVDFVATGHYAKIERQGKKTKKQISKKTTLEDSLDVKYKLLKSSDKEKDQTYFLHQVSQEELKHTLFPIGDLTKKEVRALAKKFGLPTAEKKESQEVCFVADGQVGNFLKRYVKFEKGKIKDVETNEILGEHQGLSFYTIGQRKGIGLSGGPWYVVQLDKKNNVLWVSKNENDFLREELAVKNVNWISGAEPKFPLKVKCRIRYRAKDENAVVVKIKDDKYLVKFDQAQRAITPGQYCVFWKGNKCLGGGVIV